MKRVLFYCDVGGFGGHEIMALVIMREMIALGVQVHFACLAKNERLMAEALQISGLEIHPLKFSLNRFSFLTNRVDLPKISSLRKLIRGVAPDCIVAVQGTIEISSLILPALKGVGIPVVTYIALAQSMKDLGMPRPGLREVMLRPLFSLPDRFVTIGESQKDYLLMHGVPRSKIGVVPNVAPFEVHKSVDRLQAREALGLDVGRFWFGLVGRVFAGHKGHDLLVSAVAANRELLMSMGFLIVGDGPDLGRIKRRVVEEKLDDLFLFRPWSSEMGQVYAALDAVVMPSYHEGVPLVMIEAVLSGLPVVATAIDGMREFLPESWLFPRGFKEHCAERMRFVADNDQSQLCHETRKRFRETFQRDTIGQEFLAELLLARGEVGTGEGKQPRP